jgi:hypothetical protein
MKQVVLASGPMGGRLTNFRCHFTSFGLVPKCALSAQTATE